MRDRNTLWLLLVVLIIATFLRLYQLPSLPPGHYPDEAMNGNNALEALETGEFKVYYPENNGREGLFINIQALFLAAIGKNEPWVLRLPSALFGILTVLGLYFLAKELFSKRVALLSSFLLATSFWHILFSRIGFRAIMAPLLAVWAFGFFLIALRKTREGKTRAGFVAAAAGGLFFGLGFYTYIAYRIMPLLFAILFLFFRKEKSFFAALATFLAVTFVVALPIGIYYLQNPADFLGRTAQVSIFSSPSPLGALATNTLKTLGMLNFAGDWNWRHNYAGRPELFWPVGILFLIGVVRGIKKIREFPSLFLFSWFLLAMLPVVISSEGLPHALRAILMIPPIIVFAAVGGVWLYEKIAPRIKKLILLPTLYFLLSLFVFEAYATYFIRWGGNENTPGAFSANYVELGRTLNALPREIPKYIVVETGGVLVRDLPMPTQTVMFITDTYLPHKQREKNIFYVLPSEKERLPEGAVVFTLK